MLRKLLSIYRKFQYRIYGRSEYGVMLPGKRCAVAGQENNESHGDILHPSVRYIPEGFCGHKWWMAYTPYFGANAAMENPRLCWGEEIGEGAPVTWHLHEMVKEGYERGYNSDPNLYYEEGRLYVYWRENETERLLMRGLHRGTFCKVYSECGIKEFDEPVLAEEMEYEDRNTCPTFIKVGGEYRAYAMHLVFKNEKLIGKPLLQKLSLVTDLLGFYSQQKFKGIAQWRSTSLVEAYKYERSVEITNCNKLYRPWHMDLFQHEGSIYAIIQTNMSNADICLAKSNDGVHFRFYKKPLMTNRSCGGIGIYKPTALVVNGVFYLYYTSQALDNRKLNMLFVTSMPFKELLEKLD